MNQETRDAVREGVKRSAAAVLPMVFNHLGTPTGLLDVGAGEGWWASEAARLGPNTSAVDAQERWPHDGWPYLVERWDAEERMGLPPYLPATRWPLTLCLEMAEHVSPAAGDHLVAELCRVSDQVLWSAAIPGQGGDGHVNEQWPAYWAERFRAHGFSWDDPFRLDLWHAEGVEPWYAQNLLLFYRHKGALGILDHSPLALVHPVTWAHHRGVPGPVG